MPAAIVGSAGGAQGARVSARAAPPVDSATLTADDAGQLSLSPTGNQPIDIGKGRDGRYHLNVGGQDIAFTPEQMSRLDVKAGPGNRVKMSADLDIPVSINGHPHVPGKSGQPEPVKPKGYDAVGMGADRYETAAARSGARPEIATPNAVAQADPGAAHRAVKGNNWDGVGVPGQDGARHAQSPAQAQEAEKAHKPEPDEEEKKPEKKGKKFSVVRVFDPSSDQVQMKDTPEGTVMEIHESLNLWKKMMANMRGGDGLDASAGGGAEAEIAGALLAQGMQQLRDDAANRPTEVGSSASSNNRGTPG